MWLNKWNINVMSQVCTYMIYYAVAQSSQYDWQTPGNIRQRGII